MIDEKFEWKGKKPEDMTRAELIETAYWLGEAHWKEVHRHLDQCDATARMMDTALKCLKGR